jgi:hypothetical protein
MITLFVFMALSRGTFSTLSPVMAAQQEERKRRASIDQSSTLSKETMDVLLNNGKTSSNTATTSGSTTVKTTSTTTATTEDIKLTVPKISETPKKPNNPRRHSGNLYHIMTESEFNMPARGAAATRSRGSSNAANDSRHDTPPPHKNLSINTNYESLGTELQNEALQKKLGDVLLQQQEQEKREKEEEKEEQEVPLLSNASRRPSLDN